MIELPTSRFRSQAVYRFLAWMIALTLGLFASRAPAQMPDPAKLPAAASGEHSLNGPAGANSQVTSASSGVPAARAVQGAALPAMASSLHAFDPAARDTSVDPCTDFYQYACGGWLKAHPIPADRSSYGRDTEAEDEDEQVLRTILEKAAAGGPERTPNEQKIGDAYAACMDTDAIDTAGVGPLSAKLSLVDGLKQKADLPALLARLQTAGVTGLFSFGAQQDYRDATQEIAAVGQPRLGLPEKGYYERLDGKSAELRNEYLAHVRRTFVLLGEPAVQASQDADAVLRVETALAEASLSQVEMRDPIKLYHRTPLVQFSANSPELDFSHYLEAVGAPPVRLLNVAEPLYFLSLHETLESTPMADIRALLRWNMVRAAESTALPEPLDDENFAFYGKVLEGVPQQQPRWKRCAETVDQELGEALGEVYVKQRFSPADKARAEGLTRAIENAADHDIDTLDWMSGPTKAEAKQKLRMVANNIGYPDKWRDYSSLTIARTDAFGNAERAAAFNVARNTRKIGKPVDRSEWVMTPPTVNAYYDPQLNSINFPAGILQPPYFDPTQDDAVNYGSIGGVIGHELTHGFDDEGRLFDGQGNLRDWWRKDDAKQFEERAGCVEGEYNGFVEIDDKHVNGKLTLGENLADLAGLRLAFLAYETRAKETGISLDQAGQPGDSTYGGLTPAQQFFAAYGQSWCESTRPDAMRQRVETDPHSPEQYRVNEVIENMPSFAEAFHCKAGTAMVAAKRCAIW